MVFGLVKPAGSRRPRISFTQQRVFGDARMWASRPFRRGTFHLVDRAGGQCLSAGPVASGGVEATKRQASPGGACPG